LNDRPAAVRLDCGQADGSISPSARQNDPDYTCATSLGSGAKESVNGRTVAVLPRSNRQVDVFVFDDQVPVWRRDQNFTISQTVPFVRRARRKRARPPEYVSKHARRVRRDVKHDADGRRQICGQRCNHALERLDSAGRSPNYDKIAGHGAGQRLSFRHSHSLRSILARY
jgi:hypothetical protein